MTVINSSFPEEIVQDLVLAREAVAEIIKNFPELEPHFWAIIGAMVVARRMDTITEALKGLDERAGNIACELANIADRGGA